MLKTVTPASDGGPMEAIKVESATLSGRLALHRSISGKGWTITHVPSGFAVRNRMRRKKDAEDLMLRLEEFGDVWNFTKPYGRKWLRQMHSLKPIVDEVERY